MAGYRHIHELIELRDIDSLRKLDITCPILRMRYLLLIDDFPAALKVAQTQRVRKRQIHLLMENINGRHDLWPPVLSLIELYKTPSPEPADLWLMLKLCPPQILLPYLQSICKEFVPGHGYLPLTIGADAPGSDYPHVRRGIPPSPNKIILSDEEKQVILHNYKLKCDSRWAADVKFVVDGANVLYSQSGAYKPEILASMLAKLPAENTVVVLNSRHRKTVMLAGSRILWTPRGVNDDDYAIYLAVNSGATLISNDEYGDHRARCPDKNLFDLWSHTYVLTLDADPRLRDNPSPVWQIHDGQLWIP